MLPTLLSLFLLAPTAGQAPTPTLGTPCFHAVGKLVSDLKAGKMYALSVESALMMGGNAYAEHASCGETCTGTGEASVANAPGARSGKTAIGGASSVAVPGFTAHGLTFVLYQKDGKARLRWTVSGSTYESQVDSCSNNLWTAAQGGKSGLMLHFGEKLEPPA
jgi:hypothetical protein